MHTNGHESGLKKLGRLGRALEMQSIPLQSSFVPFVCIRGLLVLCLLMTSMAGAAEGPTTLPKSPEGDFEVYDWVIFIADPSQPGLNMNAATLYQSTLPDFIGGRRNPAPPEQEAKPTPVGVIRFTGTSGTDKVDVQLTNKGGKFLAHWPKGQSRQSGVLWQNVAITEKAPASQEPAGAESWFKVLRAAVAPFILKDGRGERFLLYDLEPAQKVDLKVAPGAGALQFMLSNNGRTALKDLVVYKHADDGWHTASFASLAPINPGKAATKPATTKAGGGVVSDGAGYAIAHAHRLTVARGKAAAVAVAVNDNSDTASPATTAVIDEAPSPAPAPTSPATNPAPATTSPASRPTTHAVASATSPSTTRAATAPSGVLAQLSSTGEKDAAAVLAPWKDKLAAAGLPSTDFNLILSTLEKNGLDSKRLTAVYRLDAEQLEEILPLEVTPQPRKTTRVGLVIVRNIDPAILTEIESLVVQLGDKSWDTRETAYATLQQLGLAAKPKLEAILKSEKDPEVVYRVERLLASIGHEAGQNPNVGGRRR